MTDLATLGLQIDSSGVRNATGDLNKFGAQADKAAKSADYFQDSAGRWRDSSGKFVTATERARLGLDGFDKSSKRAGVSLRGLATKMTGAVGAFLSIQRVLGAADQYQGMINGLRAMGQSADQAVASLDAVSAIATRTRSPLEATAKLYQRISVAGADLGATQQDVLRFTENVGLALAASGTSANEASGALLQLSQAMAGGTVRAEEFNSILEGAYPIALAAAQGIEAAGGSVGQLRKLVVEGKVSSEEFFDAIISQTDALEAAFADTETTIGQATTVLGTSFTTLVGKMDAATGASSAVADAILLLANGFDLLKDNLDVVVDNLDRVAAYAGTAAVVFGGVYVASLVAAAGVTATLTGALKLLRVALIKSGIGIAVVAVGELVFRFTKLIEKTGSVGAAFGVLKDAAATVFTRIGDAIGGVTNFFLAFVADTLAAAQEWAADLVDAAKGMVVGFVDGFKDLGTKVVQAFKDAWASIVTEVSGWPADMAEIGRNIIQGLINGITGKENEVNDKLRDVMTDGINTVKDVSGVKSPSVVFAAIGSDLMAGMAIGIEAGAGEVETTLIRSGKTVVKTYSDTLRDAAAENRAYAESARKAGQEALDGLFAPIPALQALETETAKATEEIKELEGATKPAAGQAKALAKELNATERAAKGAAGAQRDLSDATGEAVEKLQEQIQQERELIGLSDDAIAEIEARRRVEDALAQDKLTWNEQAIQGLTDQIILNRQLREEAEQTSGVLRTVFDGLAKGDLKSIGTGLMDMARNSFSGLLQDSFAKGGKGLKGVWDTISSGFTGIGAAFSGAGGGLAGIGSAAAGLLPGIGSALAVVDVVKSFVGTTTKLTNAIEGTLGVMGLLRGTEYDIKQKDNIFGSKTEKNAEEIFGSWAKYIAEDLDQEFRDMVQNTRDGIRSLGLEIDEAFTYDFDVQFDESLPHEQLMERLRAELNKANDELLRTSLAAAGLARDGESGAQTLAILNESLQAVNGSMRLLDQSLLDVSAIGAGAARELVELAGGIDAFTSKTAFVFNNFLSESDRTARGLQIATENMEEFEARAGITLPKTHAEFMALLDAQDLTTEAGRELYAGLLDIADEFVTVNGAVGDLAGAAGSTREQIADMYREILGREPDMEGLNFWVDAVQNADYTIGSVASMMGRSFERLGLNAKTQAEFEKLSYEERDRIFQLRYEADKEAQKAEMELVEAREASVRVSEKAARREAQQAQAEASLRQAQESFPAELYAKQILAGIRTMDDVLKQFPGATKEAIEEAYENISVGDIARAKFVDPYILPGEVNTKSYGQRVRDAQQERIAEGYIRAEAAAAELGQTLDEFSRSVGLTTSTIFSGGGNLEAALERVGGASTELGQTLLKVADEVYEAQRDVQFGVAAVIAEKFGFLGGALSSLSEEVGSSDFEQATSNLAQLSEVLAAMSAVGGVGFDPSVFFGDPTRTLEQLEKIENVSLKTAEAEAFVLAAVVEPIKESLQIAAPELSRIAGDYFADIASLAARIDVGEVESFSNAVVRLSDMYVNGTLSLDAFNSAFDLFTERLGDNASTLKEIAEVESNIAPQLALIEKQSIDVQNYLDKAGIDKTVEEFVDKFRNEIEAGLFSIDGKGFVFKGDSRVSGRQELYNAAQIIMAQDAVAGFEAEIEALRLTLDGAAEAVSGLSEEAQNELNSLTETRDRLQAELDGVLPEFELAQLLSDEARAVQIEIRELEAALQAQAEAAQRAADVQRELESVQEQLSRARAEALGQEALREYELSLLQSDAAKTAQKEIYALTDELNKLAEEAQRAADAANELQGMQAEIARLQAELAGNLPDYEKSLLLSDAARDAYDQIAELTKALEDQAEAAQRAAAIAQERLGLETALANLLGDTAFLREQELSGLDESNRSLQEAIYLIEDENARREDAANSIRERISLLGEERAGYQALVDEARSALVALGALPDELTPLQRFEEANAAYENALGQLSSAIDREKGELENSISGLESEAERLRAALFPDESVDLVDALQVQDVLGDSLALAERLADIARDVLGQNVEIAEQQRKAALAQLQGMLVAGSIDVDNVEEIARRASAFDTSQYATREEMQFDQLLTANTINELSELQAALADEAQVAEDLRAEQARKTALDQLAALESQIAQGQDQIIRLDTLAEQFGLLQVELSSGVLVGKVEELKAAADAAKELAVAFYDKQLEDNSLLLDGIDAEISLLESQLDTLVNIQGAIEDLPSILSGIINGAISSAVNQAIAAMPKPSPLPGSGGNAFDPELAAQNSPVYNTIASEIGGGQTGAQIAQGYHGDAVSALNSAIADREAKADYLYMLQSTLPEDLGMSRREVIQAINQANLDVISADSKVDAYQKIFDSIPSYAKGTDYHPGGPAYLHQNELVNLPRGTSVSTAGEVREMVNEIKALRKNNENMARELRQVRKLTESLANIAEDKRAEELQAAAEATA